MAYREPAGEPDAPGLIRWGPFPRPMINVVMGFVGGPFLLSVAMFTLRTELLQCDRATGTCTYAHEGPLFGDQTRFAVASIVEVQWSPYTHEGADKGKTVLILRDGSQISAFDGDRDDARESYEAIDAFVGGTGPPHLTLSSRASWIATLIIAGLACFLITLGVNALRFPSSARIVVARGREIRVSERWLGIPFRSRSFTAEDVSDARVQRGTVKYVADRSGTVNRAGRLVLVTPRGTVPLTNRLLPGDDVHDRALDELRHALFDEPVPERSAPVRPPWHRRTGVRVSLFLAGIVAFAFVAQAVVVHHADATQGWLEVECATRCRHGGIECLPGGSWRSSFDPGELTIEVWDPDHPSHWRTEHIPITKGRTTRFVCR